MIAPARPCRDGARLLVALLLLLAGAQPLWAHSMYQSAVLLDLHQRTVEAELQLPLSRFEQVFGQTLTAASLAGQQPSLQSYTLSRLHATTLAGGAWSGSWAAPAILEQIDGAAYVVAHVEFAPPKGQSAHQFTLQDDVITDTLPNQVVLVSVRSDWNSSTFANEAFPSTGATAPGARASGASSGSARGTSQKAQITSSSCSRFCCLRLCLYATTPGRASPASVTVLRRFSRS